MSLRWVCSWLGVCVRAPELGTEYVSGLSTSFMQKYLHCNSSWRPHQAQHPMVLDAAQTQERNHPDVDTRSSPCASGAMYIRLFDALWSLCTDRTVARIALLTLKSCSRVLSHCLSWLHALLLCRWFPTRWQAQQSLNCSSPAWRAFWSTMMNCHLGHQKYR